MMQLATLTASRYEARAAFLEYRHAVAASYDAEAKTYDVRKLEVIAAQREADEAIMKGYRQLALGRQVIDVRETVGAAGLDSRGRPKIALARADMTRVACKVSTGGFVMFDDPNRIRNARSAARISLPQGTFAPNMMRELSEAIQRTFTGWFPTAIVPAIPPRFRPTVALERFWLLFEADWGKPPVDPALLKPIAPGLAVVVATWDLSPLERTVLGMTR